MTKTEIADALDRIKQIAESLDDAITKLAIAVEKDEKTETAQPVAEPTPQIEPGTVITLEDVRAVLTKVSGKHGAGTVKQLLAPHKKLSDVPQTEWAALIAKAEMTND